MSARNPVAVLDIRLVEEKLIDETFFQDYQKVHERVERVLERFPKPLDEATFATAEEQLLAWLHVHEEKKGPPERLTSLLRCGLGHLRVARIAGAEPALPFTEVVARSLAELRDAGLSSRTFDPDAAAAAAVKHAALERKSAPAKPAAKMNVRATGKSGANRRSEKEVFAMSDINQGTGGMGGGMASEAPKATETKPKAVRKPAVKKVAAKKPAAKKPAVKKVGASKLAAKKPAAKKVAAKKPAVKKVGASKLAAKKPAVKKVAAKKPAVKKVAAKKPAVKKVAAKKPAVKKVAAKKPAVKKVAAKKPAAKKPAVKKVAAKK